MKKNSVKIKQMVNAQDISTVLSDMSKSFKDGTVCIQTGEEFVTLKPGALIELEIEASQKKGKEKLCIELSWRQVAEVSEDESSLKITSEEPAIDEPSPVEKIMDQTAEAAEKSID